MQQTIEAAVEFLLPLIVGLVLLLWGRRFFWLLGGLVFMVSGLVLIGVLLDPNALDVVVRGDMQFEFNLQFADPPTEAQIGLAVTIAITVLISLVVGVISSLLFPRAASAVVGFAVGAFFLLLVFELFALEMPEPVRRTLLIICGTVVAVIAYRQPAETTIILSVMLGSRMIVDATHLDLNAPSSAFIWLIAMLVGIIYQTGNWRRQQLKQAATRGEAQVRAPVRT